MKRLKNLKFTNKIKEIGPRLKWFFFNEMQEYKVTSDYIDFICPEPKNKQVSSVEKLEALVKESLIKEFSPEIVNSKSYNLLVDAVMHNIQKKAVGAEEVK